MNYIRRLFLFFLMIFFADYLLPGIQVVRSTKLPHIEGDLLFAFALGCLNFLIFPCLKALGRYLVPLRIAMIVCVLNAISYAILKLWTLGIEVQTVEGYLFAVVVVSLGSFLLNYQELRRYRQVESPPSCEIVQ